MDTTPPDPILTTALPALLAKSKIGGFLYGHRKFIVFVASLLLILLNKKLNLNLDDSLLRWCAVLAMGYMGANVGEHFADAMKIKVLAPLLSGSGVQLARRPVHSDPDKTPTVQHSSKTGVTTKSIT